MTEESTGERKKIHAVDSGLIRRLNPLFPMPIPIEPPPGQSGEHLSHWFQFGPEMLKLASSFIGGYFTHFFVARRALASRHREFRSFAAAVRARLYDTEDRNLTEAYLKERDAMRDKCAMIYNDIHQSKKNRFQAACARFIWVMDTERKETIQHMSHILFQSPPEAPPHDGRSRKQILTDLLEEIIQCAK